MGTDHPVEMPAAQGTTRLRATMPVSVKTAAVIALGLPYFRWLLGICASVHYNDFGKFYYGIVSWRAGGSMYALTPASYIGSLPDPLTNLNPPHAMLLVWPFGLLPIEAAFVLWMVLNGAGLLFACVLVGRTTGWRPGFWQLGVLVLGVPTAGWLVTGQLSGVLAVPLALSWRSWREGRGHAGGVWFGAVLAIKPFLGLFVLWLAWRRDWQALGGVLAGFVGIALAGLVVFGPHSYAEWLDAMAAISWTWSAMNASAMGILTRAFTVTPYHIPMAVLPGAVGPLWALVSIALLTVLARRLRHASVDEAWFQLMAGGLLISPLGWVYYLWWLLPGLPVLLTSRSAALLLLPLIVVTLSVFDRPSPLVSLLFGSAYGWALLLAFLTSRGRRRLLVD